MVLEIEGVCLVVTSTAVADDSDTGAAVSATFAGGVARWSVCWGACLQLGSPFTICSTEFFLSGLPLLVENATAFAAVGCYLFPVLRVDVQGFHVSLADIFVAQLCESASLARGEFTMENVFGYEPILNPSHMAEPPKSALPERCEHGRKPCTLEYLRVGNLVVPVDFKDAEDGREDTICSICAPVLSRSMFHCHSGGY